MRALHFSERIGWPEYILGVAIFAFVALHAWYFGPRFSDGGIYAYLGQVVWEGKIPYVDFFYSSPPLLPYLFGVVGMIFNWHWWSWAALPIALSSLDALILYWLGKRLWSREAGVVAAVSYLFSFFVLLTTNFPTDVHFVLTALLLAGLAQVPANSAFDSEAQARGAGERERYIVSGVLLALALLIKLYAVVLVAPLIVWLLWERRWRAAAYTGLTFLGVVSLVAGIFYLVTGADFYHAIITHNVGRGEGIPKERIWRFVVAHDPWLLAGLLMPVAVRRWMPAYMLLPIAAMAVFVVGYPDMYYLYFKLLAPWLALLVGWGSWQLAREYGRGATFVMVAVVGVAAVIGAVRFVQEQAEAAVIDNFASIVAYVEDITDPTDVLYGNFEIAPLVAVESRRRIFQDIADTNVKFYLNGTVNVADRLQTLIDNRVPVMIGKAIVDGSGAVRGYEETWPPVFINRYCRVGRIFPIAQDYTHNAVVVWRCNY